MAVVYHEKERIFKLDTPNTSYIIGIVDKENFVGHVYYGKKLKDHNVGYLMGTEEAPFVPSKNNRDRVSFLDSFPMEYPCSGLGDYRGSCFEVRTAGGHNAVSLSYVSHRIYAGKPKLSGLPATFAKEGECDTLELLCEDKVLGLQVVLIYSAFKDVDVIARSVKIINKGSEAVYLTKALSCCVDMNNQDFELLTMHGSWARERMIEYRKVGHGYQGVESFRGESSHQDHPFMALKQKNATQESGSVYGFHFVYSGNFIGQVELNQFDMVRAVMGIHPENFCWKLEQNAEFQTPEVVMVYTEDGLDGMTHNYHELYRNHLIRSEYKNKKRPILINNWEATYFNFDTDKLLDIARESAKAGIEMLVMDDGWFGKRNDSSSSLGDWYVNENKLKGGLSSLIKRVNAAGLKFGIWYEPEMVSPDSDLYRAHPDWCIHTEGRAQSLARSQYMLDMSRPEVRDNVFEQMYAVLSENNIDYVKWDFNRNFTEASSSALSADRQGEFAHRYMLGTYELFDRLTKAFPDLLIESCSGGGGRFDAGMLYYSPQIWASDNTDAIDRLSIQFGTSMVYPASSMGAHVSAAARTPFATRAAVALWGTFGYELDPLRLSEEDCDEVRREVEDYHKYNELIRTGDLYRHVYPMEDLNRAAWSFVAEDKSEVLLTVVTKSSPLCNVFLIRLCGLDPDAYYREERSGRVFSGALLMKAGYNMSFERNNDGSAVMTHFVRV